ncbi:MAG: ATP-binding protein [Acidobacteriaceae bacterium]
MAENTSTVCPECNGLGLTLVVRGGERFAAQCSCRIGKRSAIRLNRARIPKRYTHCSLQNFDIPPNADPSLSLALMKARGFAERYPIETAGRGLLLTGSIGCGKTHLAVAVLRQLVEQRGATGIFCDYRDLLKQIQNSYSPQVATTEAEVLRPVFEAEILVLDELGAVKKTDWVWDTVAHILNTRYNDKKTTLITTNYPNQSCSLVEEQSTYATDREAARNSMRREAANAMRQETLGDRIGESMLSRLQQMCDTVLMHGDDHRRTVRPVAFSVSRNTSEQQLTDTKFDDVMTEFVRRRSPNS